MSSCRRGPGGPNFWTLLITCLVWNQCIAARTKIESLVGAQNQTEAVDCGGLAPGGQAYERSATGISSACINCLTTKKIKCKWCPLNLMCQKEGDACLTRTGTNRDDKLKYKAQDNKIKKNQIKYCSKKADQTPYLDVMMENYGEGWNSPENEHRFADARRCLQWSLDWPVEEDPYMKLRDPDPKDRKDKGVTVDDVGLWACKSAMLREAFIGLITGDFANLTVKWRRSSGTSKNSEAHPVSSPSAANNTVDDWEFVSPNEAVMEEKSLSAIASPIMSPEEDEEQGTIMLETLSKSSSGPQWKVQQVRPRLCDFLAFKSGSSKACEVHAYGAEEFKVLREAFAQPNAQDDMVTTNLLEELMAGPIVSFNPGGGKSGSGFSRTWNNKYKIKLALKRGKANDLFINEPQNLLYLVKGRPGFRDGSVSLQEHFRDHPDSMLNRYYGLVKLVIGGSGAYCLLMQDAMYNLMEKAAEWKHPVHPSLNPAPWVAHSKLYDLKGTSRDQEKASPGKTGYNYEFKKEQPDGVLMLSDEQCQFVRKSFDADSYFLKAHKLVDYSIMILIVDLTYDAPPGLFCMGTAGSPYCEEASYDCGGRTCRKGYTFSVIDYLNDKNLMKSYEMMNGQYKFAHYGASIRNYMAGICRTRREKETFRVFAHAARTAMGGATVEEIWGEISNGEEEVSRHQFIQNTQKLGIPSGLHTAEGVIDMYTIFADLVEEGKDTISKDEFMQPFDF